MAKKEEKGKIELSEKDWDILFKSTPVILGETTVEIKPLEVEQLYGLAQSIKKLFEGGELKEGSPFSTENLEVLRKHIPGILSDITGISEKVITRLPLGKFVEIMTAVLDSDSELIKNLLSLMEKLETVIPIIKAV